MKKMLKRGSLVKFLQNSLDNNKKSEFLLENARLNLKDGSSSEFPANAYRIWVQAEASPRKPPHIHIKSYQEEWEIKVFIENGTLWKVKHFGQRKRTDKFVDIINRLRRWFSESTMMPGRVGTNQEAALNEWEASNS